jgi:hypothetical protein
MNRIESDVAAFVDGIRAADKVLDAEFRLDVFHPHRVALRDLIYRTKDEADRELLQLRQSRPSADGRL